MRFKKAIHEQSREELKSYAHMAEPDDMYKSDGMNGTNAAKTTIKGRETNPDNEELIISIQRAMMLSNFEQAEKMMHDNYDQFNLKDINRLIQFEKYIWGDRVKDIAIKKTKPNYENFGPRLIKSVRKKMSPK